MMNLPEAPSIGRRERNKQEKLERITAAAGALFAERGIDDVTTHEIAAAAEVGTGTLFLYVKTKGELLLLVQNAHYAEALARGRPAAEAASTALDAVMAYVDPIIRCNRIHVGNGRTYLREMFFGDATEHYHAAALEIAAQTQRSIADVITERAGLPRERAEGMAQIVSSVLFVSLGADTGASVTEISRDIRRQVALLLGVQNESAPSQDIARTM